MGRTKTIQKKSQKPAHEVRRQAIIDALLRVNVPPDIARYVAAKDENAQQAMRMEAVAAEKHLDLLRNLTTVPEAKKKRKRKN